MTFQQNRWVPEDKEDKVFEMLREKKNSVTLEILYSAKIYFKNINEIKIFSDKIYCHQYIIK